MPVKLATSIAFEVMAAHLDLGLSVWIDEHGEHILVNSLSVEQGWDEELSSGVLIRW